MSNIFAIVATSGQQFRAQVNGVIEVNRIEKEVGETVVLDNVLLLQKEDGSVLVGEQAIKVEVRATVISHYRAKKLRIFKMRRRKSSRLTKGHRQDKTQLRIDELVV